MNQHILQGKWRQLRGGFKKQWGRLTDDDLSRIQGAFDQILGVIQQRYGYTRDRTEREIEEYLSAYNRQIDDYSERMKAYGKQLNEYGEQMRDYNKQMQSQVRTAMENASSKVQEQQARAEALREDAVDRLGRKEDRSRGNAWVAVLAGFALFALVAYLFNRQSS